MPPQQMSGRGKAFRRGARYGSRLKKAIYANLTNFWSACSAVGLDKFDVIEEARYLAQDYSDWLIEEIRGIARGS
ncbi:MAG: hypothetical protein ACE10C_10870, partial [Candidatus Binatia bacterium]